MGVRALRANLVRSRNGRVLRVRPTAAKKDEGKPSSLEDALLSTHEVDKDTLETLLKEAIENDPKMAAQIEGVRAAARKVAELKAQRAELEALTAEAQAREDGEQQSAQAADQKAAERGAQLDVVDAASEVRAALVELEEATAARQRAMDASARLPAKWESADIDEAAEKVQSGKAAVLAGGVGALASAPFALSADTWSQLALASGGAVLSCALFGLTYRYAVRSDLGNGQLKGGVVAAFGLVRAAAQAESTLSSSGLTTDSILQCTLYAGESMFIFAAAAAAMEIAFQNFFLVPFGTAGKDQ